MMDVHQPELLKSFTDTSIRSKNFKDLHPQAIVDGSKIIFRLGKSNTIAFDPPTRILFATPKIEVKTASGRTRIVCQDTYNLIVIDSGFSGYRFFPVSLSHYGTVYTRDAQVHAVLGAHRRHKVSSRALPYRSCNKFENSAGDIPHPEDDDGDVADRQTDQADGMLYLRGNESMTRYRLCKGEKINLHGGELAAWTLGVHFDFRTVACCFRSVSAVTGEGTVWIQRPKNRCVSEPESFER